MSRLEKIKQRAAQFAERRTDDSRTDQAEARVERARKEARKEAKRERVQQRAEKAREEERERVLNEDRGSGGIVSSVVSTIEEATEAVDDGDNERLDDISQAMGTDFDGDGEPFAQEIGLQSAARADAENQAIQGLGQQVDRNTGRISELEDVGVPDPGFGSGSPPGVGGGNGNAGFGVSEDEVFGATDEEIFGSSAEEMFGGADDEMFGGRGGGL
jgi:hypothetical protein